MTNTLLGLPYIYPPGMPEQLINVMLNIGVNTTEDFVKKLGLNSIKHRAGYGLYGEVWKLKDGSVVKITGSTLETSCVEQLFNVQESNPSEYVKYFPKIYSYGNITQFLIWEDNHHVEVVPAVLGTPFERVAFFPVFWYHRENIETMPYSSENALRVDEANKAIRSTFGIDLVDPHFNNWGLRKETNEVIFRDLVCVPKGQRQPSIQIDFNKANIVTEEVLLNIINKRSPK